MFNAPIELIVEVYMHKGEGEGVSICATKPLKPFFLCLNSRFMGDFKIEVYCHLR